MRPVVEGMGLDWASQLTKLKESQSRFNHCDIASVGADGRQREMTCIPLRRYPMWLATINLARIFCRRTALFALSPIAAVELRTAPVRERAGCRASLAHGGRRVLSPSATLGHPESLRGDVGLTHSRHHAVGPRCVLAHRW